MKSFCALLVLALASAATADIVTVPQDACFWRGQRYGQMLYCEDGEVAVGSCGSGRNDDCDSNQWHQLLCCQLPGYLFYNCQDFKGAYGEQLSCPDLTHRSNSLVEGSCGSGRRGDCSGETHIVHCCNGRMTGDLDLQSTGICYWTFGVYGEKVRCNRDDEAVFGRCGSGLNDDCGAQKWHGIQCCQIESVPSTHH